MGTRAKTKKAKDAGETRQDVLRKVAASKQLSFEEKGKLYHWDRPNCQGDRVNIKDSPNCLCALIPPPNGVRKQGLWSKVPEAVTALGEDPAYRKRVSQDDPIGLTNLGATCYVNSILQCLYMNTDFRKGLFLVEEKLLESNPVLRQLCRLFVKLQLSNEDPVDPAVFAKTLQLDNGVQQDGQEFMKLLLTLLEKLLGQSGNADIRELVQRLFRGTFSYVTRCSVCGNESDSSKKLVDFYELEVNVKGFEGLDESLDDYLGEEVLEGDNQYVCERCNARVDATRSVKLRSLPPLLNFQLKRFVFNNKTATKKKVTSRFSFPVSIDLKPRLTPALLNPEPEPSVSTQSGRYDLAAILVHKGALATSGHYIAHIKDERTGDWWQFDDEIVTSLGAHPLGEAAGVAKPPKENGQKEEEKEKETGEKEKEEEKGAGERIEISDPNLLSSADSYMLMYRRRDERQVAAMQRQEERRRKSVEAAATKLEGEMNHLDGKESKRKSEGEGREKVAKRARTGKGASEGEANSHLAGTSGKKPIALDSPVKGETHVNGFGGHGNGGGSSQELDDEGLPEAPQALVREVENDNEVFLASIKAFRVERERIEAEVKLRQQEVREILTEADAKPDEFDFNWISTDWLKAWADSKDPPGMIKNASLLCEHEKVPPQKVTQMKRINRRTWQELDHRYSGGPELGADDCCEECIRRDADEAQSADSFRTRRAAMREQLENELALGVRGTHYVSKQWLSQWQRRKLVDSPSDADKGPTAALQCPHDGLKPEFAPGAKRQVVTGEFWEYIQGIAEEVAGKDDRGHWDMPASVVECEACRVALGEAMSNREGLKSGKLAEKAALEALFTGRPLLLSEGVNTFLVPSKWLEYWREYVGATGKHLDVIGEPPSLDDALTAVFCKHGSLAVGPPELTSRKNDVLQSQKPSFFTIVSEADWRQLQKRWGSSVEISAAVGPREPDSKPSEKDKCPKDVKEGPVPVADTRPVPSLKTVPEVCDTCYKDRLGQELAERLSYRQQEIIVELFRGSRPPAYATNGGEAGGERRSKRSRKASNIGGGRTTLKVNADTTVKDLKMTIWERMGVDEANQRLGFMDKELEDDDTIVSDYGIVANSRLWLINTGEYANRDIVECFETEEEAGEMENGFKGTGLWAGASEVGAFPKDADMEDSDGSASGPSGTSERLDSSGAGENVGNGTVCDKGAVSEGAAQKDSEQWSCKICTLDNSPGKKRCQACERERS